MMILHIITGLPAGGGAQSMLFNLLSCMDKSEFTNQVISLTSKGVTADKIEALGIEVHALNMRQGMPDPRAVWNLKRLIQKIRPNVIQTWMYHPDLIGGLAAKWAGRIPVIWNIRHSNLDPRDNKKTTIWTAKACALLSRRLPRSIACCSEASSRVHTQIGYDQHRMQVIPNGFNLDAFQPDREARDSLCHQLDIHQETLLMGMAARFNLQKDHYTLVQAASILKAQGIDFRVILCGRDINRDNAQLTSWIKEAGLEDRFFLLGPREDMPRITAALDIGVLSSAHGEGFPNVLGEAMACEVPCVATDVGDSAEIIGDTGFVVPPREPKALAHALKRMADMGPNGRAELGANARKRINERFELSTVVKKYESLYRMVGERAKH